MSFFQWLQLTQIQTETLNPLEWQRLCQHLSTFATTKLGAIAYGV